jgi:hypothetical protein
MSEDVIKAIQNQSGAVSMGGYGNAFSIRNKRTVRAPINPMDKCTVFSIYSKQIEERKPTIQPGFFVIPAGSYEAPSRLVVGPSSWWREVDLDQPLLEIPHGSVTIAESIVRDYVIGLLGRDNDAQPGIFWVPGDISIKQLKSDPKYIAVLDQANKMQDKWYENLVKLADVGWARTNGNPMAINDDMRFAAKALRLDHKDWMTDFKQMQTVACIACGHARNPKFPICSNCHTIVDMDLYQKAGLSAAPAVGQQVTQGQNMSSPAAPNLTFPSK